MKEKITELKAILSELKLMESDINDLVSALDGCSNISVDRNLALSYIQSAKEQVWSMIGKISNYC